MAITPAELAEDAAFGRRICGIPACRLPDGRYVYAPHLSEDRAVARSSEDGRRKFEKHVSNWRFTQILKITAE